MAIRDLLWACPLCKNEGTLESTRKGDRCTVCGTTFSRSRGASITALSPDQTKTTRSAAEWVDLLPEIDLAERIERGGGVIHTQEALLRLISHTEEITYRGRYLNLIEHFGPQREGRLTLEEDRLTFEPGEITWEFDRIRAVQPSSRTLQINCEVVPLASIEVPNGSIRFWELILCEALRAYYEREGRGEIVEFQPWIRTRTQQVG